MSRLLDLDPRTGQGNPASSIVGKPEEADTFQEKYQFREQEKNEYSELKVLNLEVPDWEFEIEEVAKKTLENLKEASATGPDGLPTRVLKFCAEELAKPFLLLAQRVLDTGRWPTLWCEHWIIFL